MRITKLTVKNFMAIEQMELETALWNVFEGDNEEGKSSLVEAVKYAVGKGHDPDMLRTGADAGEVRLDLDDGRAICTIIKAPDEKHPEGNTDRQVILPHGGKAGRAATILEQIRDLASVNPVGFLLADEKQQMQLLLESAALAFDARKLRAAAGIPLETEVVEGDPLEVISRVRDRVYDQRTGVNRLANDKRATARQLAETLTAAPDPRAELTERQQELERVNAVISQTETAGHERIQAQLSKMRAKAGEAEKIESIEDEKRIAAIRLAAAERKAIAKEILTECEQKIKADIAAESIEATRPLYERQKVLEVEVPTLEERRRNWEDVQRARAFAAKTEKEAVEHEKEADALTAALERIDAYKAELLKKLPFEGLEFREGKLYLNGVRFKRVNTAKRVAFAVKRAALTVGPLAVICVDDLEHFSERNLAALERALASKGIQAFGGRLTTGPLHVETKG